MPGFDAGSRGSWRCYDRFRCWRSTSGGFRPLWRECIPEVSTLVEGPTAAIGYGDRINCPD
ncbi:hypothetical protein [Synechococcus sp. UW179A]|uniref:hypothetical protein n=1 Tax=Synechococcus sp. UW179A TaxID=2575510 RepID=UPI0010BE2224|nr:hypothetical protein [Synechococcus sp. UW179A]